MEAAYIMNMKQSIAATAIIALTAIPLAAEEALPMPDDTELDEGFSLMEEGAKLLLRGLMTEIEPKLDELKDMTDEMGAAMAEFGETMGPALAELMTRVDDMRNYEPPEILPNGDIIIRRSPDAPIYNPDSETGEIEL